MGNGTGETTGAQTPEELETLLEDALLVRDGAMVAALFEERAVLAASDRASVCGDTAIANLALTLWTHDHAFVAATHRVVQARDLALIVAEQAISVVRRGRDGSWRYVIAVVPCAGTPQGGTDGADE